MRPGGAVAGGETDNLRGARYSYVLAGAYVLRGA